MQPPRSRFGPSRFGHAQAGQWIGTSPPDAGGRAPGSYRIGPEGAAVAELTLVKALAGSTKAPEGTSKEPRQPAPRALHLPGSRTGVLLFHGLATTPLKLQFLARGLHRAGFTVRVAAIEGYTRGLNPTQPNGHREWAEAALAEFDRLRAQCDTVAVGGLCIGAVLALHIAARRSAEVSHVLALSTTLHFDGWAAPRSRWVVPLARVSSRVGRLAVKEREPYGVKDERLRAWIAAQLKESDGSEPVSAGLQVRDLLEAKRLMAIVRREMRDVLAPTLLIHARDDDMASPRSAFEVASGVSSEKVNCVLLNDSYHLISIDKEKARVLAELKQFLQVQQQDADATNARRSNAEPIPTTRSPEHVRI